MTKASAACGGYSEPEEEPAIDQCAAIASSGTIADLRRCKGSPVTFAYFVPVQSKALPAGELGIILIVA